MSSNQTGSIRVNVTALGMILWMLVLRNGTCYPGKVYTMVLALYVSARWTYVWWGILLYYVLPIIRSI